MPISCLICGHQNTYPTPLPLVLTQARFSKTAETRGCRVRTRMCLRATHTHHGTIGTTKTMIPKGGETQVRGVRTGLEVWARSEAELLTEHISDVLFLLTGTKLMRRELLRYPCMYESYGPHPKGTGPRSLTPSPGWPRVSILHSGCKGRCAGWTLKCGVGGPFAIMAKQAWPLVLRDMHNWSKFRDPKRWGTCFGR